MSSVAPHPVKNPFSVGQIVDWRDTPMDYDGAAVEKWVAMYGGGPYRVVRTREAQSGTSLGDRFSEPPYVHIATPLGGEQSFGYTWFKLVSAG